MSLTNVSELAALQHVLTGTYVALMTAPPAEDGLGGAEVEGAGYARQAWAPTYELNDDGLAVAANSADLVYVAGANWGEITHVAIVDSPTVGVGTYKAVLPVVSPDDGVTPQPRTVFSGDEFRLPPGTLTVTME